VQEKYLGWVFEFCSRSRLPFFSRNFNQVFSEGVSVVHSNQGGLTYEDEAVSSQMKDSTTRFSSRSQKSSPTPLLAPPHSIQYPPPPWLSSSTHSSLPSTPAVRPDTEHQQLQVEAPGHPHAAAEPLEFLIVVNASWGSTRPLILNSQHQQDSPRVRAFPLMQFHYQCIHFMRRGPRLLLGRRRRSRRCAGELEVGSESGERWIRGWKLWLIVGIVKLGSECGRPARLKMVSVVGFIVSLLGC